MTVNQPVVTQDQQDKAHLHEVVRDVFLKHTGYARDDFPLEADFESDLGIDSVTLAIVLSDLYKVCQLTNLDIPDGVHSIVEVTDDLVGRLAAEGLSTPAQSGEETAASVPVADEADPVAGAVIEHFARHTGYSREDLVSGADLQADMGIDSITQTAALSDVSKALGLFGKGEFPDGLATLADVIDYFRAQLAKSAPEPVTEPDDGSGGGGDEDTWTRVLEQLYALEPRLDSDSGDDLLSELSFSVMGMGKKELAGLHQRLSAEHGAPEIIRLSDCDTPEKVLNYLRVVRRQGVESVTDSLSRAKQRRFDAPDTTDRRTMKDFASIPSRDLFHKTHEFRKFYQQKQQEQLYWYGMPLESRCSNRSVIYDEITGKRREYLMFASNNYLGLANHPEVIEAIADGARQYGATNTGCRLIGGSNVLHKTLEERLANLKGREACIVYPSGYSANLGCISALVGQNDLVFTDAINHMSIQDGCKLAGAGRRIFQHGLDNLERTLQKHADHDGGKLIVTDGVFSMHGDIVDLPRLVALARKYDARVLVDEAHSTGVLGKTGSGTAEHFNMKGEVDLELGTMSKALAGLGGFVCADEDVVEYLRFYSNSYVFAATIPAPVAGGLIKSIDIMEREPERLVQLWANIRRLQGHLLEAGFDLSDADSAIIPVVVGDDQLTLKFGRAVRARGMFCQTVVYPGVSVGDARLRISVTSEHTHEDLDLAAEIVIDAAKEVGIPVHR